MECGGDGDSESEDGDGGGLDSGDEEDAILLQKILPVVQDLADRLLEIASSEATLDIHRQNIYDLRRRLVDGVEAVLDRVVPRSHGR